MIVLPPTAPLAGIVVPLARAAGLEVDPEFLPPKLAIGSRYAEDALDAAADPTVDRQQLAQQLMAHGVEVNSAKKLTELLVDREEVFDLSTLKLEPDRPLTLFEHAALSDVVGEELAKFVPPSAVLVQRRRAARGLNDCTVSSEGVARIRLLTTNGTTLAGRTHALVHELGHALVGIAQRHGYRYGAGYGQPDYGRWLPSDTWEQVMDEEALVRALADAWLLRRPRVTWTRTFPGAIDQPGRSLDADWLAAFVRFRLRQGLGMTVSPQELRALAVGIRP